MKKLNWNIYEKEQFEKALQEKVQLKLGAEDFSGTLSELKDKIILIKTESKLSEQELKSQEEIIKWEFFKRLKSLYGNGYSDEFYRSRSWHIINNKSEEISRLYHWKEVKTKGFSFMSDTQIQTFWNAWDKKNDKKNEQKTLDEAKEKELFNKLDDINKKLHEVKNILEANADFFSIISNGEEESITIDLEFVSNAISKLPHHEFKNSKNLNRYKQILNRYKDIVSWIGLYVKIPELIKKLKITKIEDIMKPAAEGDFNPFQGIDDIQYTINKKANGQSETKIYTVDTKSYPKKLDQLQTIIQMHYDQWSNQDADKAAWLRINQIVQTFLQDIMNDEKLPEEERKNQLIRLICILTWRTLAYKFYSSGWHPLYKAWDENIFKWIQFDPIANNSIRNIDFKLVDDIINSMMDRYKITEWIQNTFIDKLPKLELKHSIQELKTMFVTEVEDENWTSIPTGYVELNTIGDLSHCTYNQRILLETLDKAYDDQWWAATDSTGKAFMKYKNEGDELMKKQKELITKAESLYQNSPEFSTIQAEFDTLQSQISSINSNFTKQQDTMSEIEKWVKDKYREHIEKFLQNTTRSIGNGKRAKDFDFLNNPYDKAILNLHQAIKWSGGISQETLISSYEVGKWVLEFWSIIASMFIPWPGRANATRWIRVLRWIRMWRYAQMWLRWAITWTVARTIFWEKKAYVDIEDFALDRWSEFVTNGITGAFGGALGSYNKVFRANGNRAKTLISNKTAFATFLWLTATDVSVWVVTERARINYLLKEEAPLGQMFNNPMVFMGALLWLSGMKKISTWEYDNLMKNLARIKEYSDSHPEFATQEVTVHIEWKPFTTTVEKLIKNFTLGKWITEWNYEKYKGITERRTWNNENTGIRKTDIVNDFLISKNTAIEDNDARISEANRQLEEVGLLRRWAKLTEEQGQWIIDVHNLSSVWLEKIQALYNNKFYQTQIKWADGKFTSKTTRELNTAWKNKLAEIVANDKKLVWEWKRVSKPEVWTHEDRQLNIKKRALEDYGKLSSDQAWYCVKSWLTGHTGGKTIEQLWNLLKDWDYESKDTDDISALETKQRDLEQHIENIEKMLKLMEDKTWELTTNLWEKDIAIKVKQEEIKTNAKGKNKALILKNEKEDLKINNPTNDTDLQKLLDERDELTKKIEEEKEYQKLKTDLEDKKSILESKRNELKTKLDRKTVIENFENKKRSVEEKTKDIEKNIEDWNLESVEVEILQLDNEIKSLISLKNTLSSQKINVEYRDTNKVAELKTKFSTKVNEIAVDIKKKFEAELKTYNEKSIADTFHVTDDPIVLKKAITESEKSFKSLKGFFDDLSNLPEKQIQFIKKKLGKDLDDAKNHNVQLNQKQKERDLAVKNKDAKLTQFWKLDKKYKEIETKISSNGIESVTEEDLKALKQLDKDRSPTNENSEFRDGKYDDSKLVSARYQEIQDQISLRDTNLLEYRNISLKNNCKLADDKIKILKTKLGDTLYTGSYKYHSKDAIDLKNLVDQWKSEIKDIETDLKAAKEHNDHATDSASKRKLNELEDEKRKLETEITKVEELINKVAQYEQRIKDFKDKFNKFNDINEKASVIKWDLEKIRDQIDSLASDREFAKIDKGWKTYADYINEQKAKINKFINVDFAKHKFNQYNTAMDELEVAVNNMNKSNDITDDDIAKIETLKELVNIRKDGLVDKNDATKENIPKSNPPEKYSERERRLIEATNFNGIRLDKMNDAMNRFETHVSTINAKDHISEVDIARLNDLKREIDSYKWKLKNPDEKINATIPNSNQTYGQRYNILFREWWTLDTVTKFRYRHKDYQDFKNDCYNPTEQRIWRIDPKNSNARWEVELMEIEIWLLEYRANKLDEDKWRAKALDEVNELRWSLVNKKEQIWWWKIFKNKHLWLNYYRSLFKWGSIHEHILNMTFRNKPGGFDGDTHARNYGNYLLSQINKLKITTDDLTLKTSDALDWINKNSTKNPDWTTTVKDQSWLMWKIEWLLIWFKAANGILWKLWVIWKNIITFDESFWTLAYSAWWAAYGAYTGWPLWWLAMWLEHRAVVWPLTRSWQMRAVWILLNTILLKYGPEWLWPDGATEWIYEHLGINFLSKNNTLNQLIPGENITRLMFIKEKMDTSPGFVSRLTDLKQKLTDDDSSNDAKAKADLEKLYIEHLVDQNINTLPMWVKAYINDNKKEIIGQLSIEQAKDSNLILIKAKEYARNENSGNLVPKSKKQIKEEWFEWLLDYPDLIEANKKQALKTRNEAIKLYPDVKNITDYYARYGNWNTWLEDRLTTTAWTTTLSNATTSENTAKPEIPEPIKTELINLYQQYGLIRDYTPTGSSITYTYDGTTFGIKK